MVQEIAARAINLKKSQQLLELFQLPPPHLCVREVHICRKLDLLEMVALTDTLVPQAPSVG
ncbi:hypothetical protein TYRP_023380 [Tyrophagus putrescentiae]|nr:hypothetical protein TYRP_023380 [Tyrophagus putrescentiae]